MRLVRTFRPHVITTYDENGGYPHPDHIMCHKVSVEAFEAAADPDRYPGTGEPWQPLKLYYHMTFHKARFMAMHDGDGRGRSRVAVRGAAQGVGASGRDMGDRVTTRVPCADYFDVRDKALIAHATQVDPTSFWFACPLEIQQKAWPTEDYELARSLVDTATARGRPVRRDQGRGAAMTLDGVSSHGVLLASGDNALGAGFIAFIVVLALGRRVLLPVPVDDPASAKVPAIVRTASPTDTGTEK